LFQIRRAIQLDKETLPTDGPFYIAISGLISRKCVKMFAIDEGGVPVASTWWRMVRREAALRMGCAQAGRQTTSICFGSPSATEPFLFVLQQDGII
jgi:hypothetical protein